MKKQLNQNTPISVFYSYAQEDEKLRTQLDKHLSLLQRNNIITTWHNRQIIAGTDRADTIDDHLNEASLILLLISPDFLASDYCYTREMRRALERHKNGEASVIPIILRPVEWDEAPFAHLQCLPLDGKPVTLWENRDAALLQIAKGIRDAIKALSISIHPIAPSDRYRQRLLKAVRNIWITDVLERSLYHTDPLVLNMYEQPDAINNPWQDTVQETKRSSNPLILGSHIIQIYDDADGDLLILGEPGSGKTTQLLELTRNLIDRAEQDAKHPIPVVFNIASYDEYQKEEEKNCDHKENLLTTWLVNELNRKYKIPRRVGEIWIQNDHVLPLLDGLDEVEEKYQAKCIAMINAWKQEYTLLPLVVCSRFTEYMAKKDRLWLQKAIAIQPLTLQEVDTYLRGKGEPFHSLLLMLQHDSELQDVASTPLMLHILVLVCKENPAILEKISSHRGSIKARRKQIFEVYTQQMLCRRRKKQNYSTEQIIYSLSWLARLHIQTFDKCLFSNSQAEWFPQVWPRRLYTFCRNSIYAIAFTIISCINLLCVGSLTYILFHPLNILLFVLLFLVTFTSIGSWLSCGMWAVGAFSSNYTQSVNGKKGTYICFGAYVMFAFISLLVHQIWTALLLLIASSVLVIPLFCFAYPLYILLHMLLRLITRLLLYWSGCMPWNYQQFLDYVAERILLRKERNSYIFIHALLRNYFASLNNVPPT